MTKAVKFRKEREVSKEERDVHSDLCKILYLLYSNYIPILKILLIQLCHSKGFCSLKLTDKINRQN